MCCIVVADLRRQSVVDKSSVDVRSSSSRRHHELNGAPCELSSAGRRRARKTRDGTAAAMMGGDTRTQLTDSTDDDATAVDDTSRPSRKLRRRKKNRCSNKTDRRSVELVVEPAAIELNRLSDGVTAAAAASPELDDVDRLSSSRPEPEVLDCSARSTLSSSRSSLMMQRRRREPPSTTSTSTTLYGQQAATAAALLSDVHASLPLLTSAFDEDRRVTSPVNHDVVSKSASYQHFLTVDDPLTARRRHRRMMGATYRPLAQQRARHTLSQLDVEYINRSQIFEMISGHSLHSHPARPGR